MIKSQSTIYDKLDLKRDIVWAEEIQKLRDSIQKADEKTKDSIEFIKALVSNNVDLAMNYLIKFNKSSVKKVDQNFHFIFALDKSGSMAGSSWNNLMSAFNQFLNARLAAEPKNPDIVSVIFYASSAEIVEKYCDLGTLIAKGIQGKPTGGTYFTVALRSIE